MSLHRRINPVSLSYGLSLLLLPFVCCGLSPLFGVVTAWAQENESQQVKREIVVTRTPSSPHLVRPRPEIVEKILRDQNLLKPEMSRDEVKAAVAGFYQRFEKKSPRWVNPEVRDRAIQIERSLDLTSSYSRNGDDGLESRNVTPIEASILVIAVEFGGTDSYPAWVWENGNCIQKMVTRNGPRRGQIPAPDPEDNFSFWYEPDQTKDPSFYEDLIFGYEGIGRVRMDLFDPEDGNPGINMSGRTVQDFYERIAGPGNVQFTGSVEGWVTVNHSAGYYGEDDCRTGAHGGGGPATSAQLAVDALKQFNQQNPEYYEDTSTHAFWPQYDKNKDGLLDTFWLIFAGQSQDEGGGRETLWSHSGDVRSIWKYANGYKVYEGNPATENDDIYVGPYTVQPEDLGLGVIVHELGHNLFGLPDLYCTDLSNSIGFWDTWGSGSWTGWLGGAMPVRMALIHRILAQCGNQPCNWHTPLYVRAHNDPQTDAFLGQMNNTPDKTFKGARINLPDLEVHVPNRAGSGFGVHTGNRKDQADLRLTREIQVPDYGSPILSFRSWWDIEPFWDYGYVILVNGNQSIFLSDMDGVFTSENPNGTSLGIGLTGRTGSSAPAVLRFDLSQWRGKTVKIRFRYRTDVAVTHPGWWIDEVRINDKLIDDFENAQTRAAIPGWGNSNPGWEINPTAKQYPNYYLVEWRNMEDYDRGLQTAYYWETGNEVRRLSYNLPGAVIYYRDGRFGFDYTMGQNFFLPPSSGPKHALLVVDLNYFPDTLGSLDRPFYKRLSSYDAALTLQPAPSFEIDQLWQNGQIVEGPWTIPQKPAVQLFDDSKGYSAGYYSCNEGNICSHTDADSAVIPARGFYPVRITDEDHNPLESRYGNTYAWTTDNMMNGCGMQLGSGNPGQWSVQHGVKIQLLSKSADNRSGKLRFMYARPASGPNLQVHVQRTHPFIIGHTNRYTVTVTNVGLSPTTGKITLTGDLPPDFSFVSAESDGWTCQPAENGYSCETNQVLESSEMSQLKIFSTIAPQAGPHQWGTVRVSTPGEVTQDNSLMSHYIRVFDATVFYFPQIGDGTFGNGTFQTTLILSNNGSEESVVIVEFFKSDGTPLVVPLIDHGAGSEFRFALRRGNSISVKSAGGGSVRVGYAKVTAGENVDGTAVFGYTQNGVLMFEAGVPAVRPMDDFTIFMEADGISSNTGLAFVNVGEGNAHVNFRLYDSNYQLVKMVNLADLGLPAIQPGQHLARYATEIFQGLAGNTVKLGLITVQSNQMLAPITLRQNDQPTVHYPNDIWRLCAFPVVEGRPETEGAFPSASNVVYFPQIGDGKSGSLGFKTAFLFSSLSGNSQLKMEFFKSDGTPMKVSFPGLGEASVFNLNLRKGEVHKYETLGVSGLQVGYVKLTSATPISAAAVLSCSIDGVGQFEAGVPAVKGQKDFTIYVDSDNVSKATGMAFVNVGNYKAQVTFRIYDQHFNTRATKTLEEIQGALFDPGNHLAIYASEIFDGIVPESLKNGLITVESNRPLAATTLHQFYPSQVYVLTAYPVMSGRADKD